MVKHGTRKLANSNLHMGVPGTRTGHRGSHVRVRWTEDQLVSVATPQRRRTKRRVRLVKKNLPQVQKVGNRRQNGGLKMGSASWLSSMHRFRKGPTTIEELYKWHLSMADHLAQPDTPGTLSNAIDMLKHGVEKYSDFSGVRFDCEAFTLLEESLEEHLSPYKTQWSLEKFAVHTHSCDISQPCVNTLIELSDDLDRGCSCVTRGVETRIAKHHLDKFVDILGTNAPSKQSLTKEEKEEQIEKNDRFKVHVLDQRHIIFPKRAKAFCYKHGTMCRTGHRQRHCKGFNANRLRIATGSPECVAWSPMGKNLAKADDSQFSAILHLAQRKVEAENETEDLWFEECGPNSQPSKHDDLQDTHTIVSVKFGCQHSGIPMGRERRFSSGLAKFAIIWVGPQSPEDIQEDFEQFAFTSSEITSASMFFRASDEEVRATYEHRLVRRGLQGLAGDKTYNVNDWDMFEQTLSPCAKRRQQEYRECAEAAGDEEVCWDVDQNMDTKFGQVSPFWPPMLRHATVACLRHKRGATPLEYLGVFGTDPYPQEGSRKSHLVNVVNSLSPNQAISRIGNGVSPLCYFSWMLYVFSNCRRRQKEAIQIWPLTQSVEDEQSDEEVGRLEADDGDDEDDFIKTSVKDEDDPRTPLGHPPAHHVLTPCIQLTRLQSLASQLVDL